VVGLWSHRSSPSSPATEVEYATLAEDPNTDPVVTPLATPDGTCKLLIPKDRYEPLLIVAMVEGWNRKEP
jgi:hypothetical protein